MTTVIFVKTVTVRMAAQSAPGDRVSATPLPGDDCLVTVSDDVSPAPRAPGADPVVSTPLGVLRGSRDQGVLRFRGVRYAHAGRFEQPRPVMSWEGVRDALEEGAMCPQPPFTLALLARPKPIPPMDEDCFFLNITAPDAPSDALRPVMLWIHGGSYVNGSGGGGIYDPTRLVRDGDVIVVGINYRLGAFGFLALDGVAPGNLGIQDQLAALEWVLHNIESFGGDPDNVTLFGQSAGADAIANLIAIPEADRLFSRAILQSAPLGLHRSRDAVARQVGANFLASLAGNPLAATVDELLAAQVAAMSPLSGDPFTAGMPYAPIADAWPVPPTTDVVAGRARRSGSLSVLIGYNRDDFSPFLEGVGVLRRARASSLLKPLTNPLCALLTWRVFGRPALELARQLREGQLREAQPRERQPKAEHDSAEQPGRIGVATYRFDWRPKGTPWGACHCVELPFFWGDEEFWRGSPMLAGVDWHDLETLGGELRREWAAFARGGVAALGWPTSRRGRVDRQITFAPRYGPR